MDPEIVRQINELIQRPGDIRDFLQQTQTVVDQTQPQINVPVRQVPPPVRIRGRVELFIDFDWENIAGVSPEDIRSKVYQVLNGERHPTLPRIWLGELELWREEVYDPQPGANVRTGIPGTDHQNNIGYAGDIDYGTDKREGE